MKKNLGNTDRIVRLILTLVIAVLYFTEQISGTAAIVLGLFAVTFLLTSALRFCPLYLPFGVSTMKKTEA